MTPEQLNSRLRRFKTDWCERKRGHRRRNVRSAAGSFTCLDCHITILRINMLSGGIMPRLTPGSITLD